jgi:F-type H+-transporting ATPase subunit gamma
MRRPQEIGLEEKSMGIIVSLTSAFEGLASMRIMRTKNQVAVSNKFFNEVWNIYKLIRIDGMFGFGRKPNETAIDKELLVLITAPGGLSGDIDQRLIRMMREKYSAEKHDVLVIGRHGLLQLQQFKIPYTKFFNLPKHDIVNVEPLVTEVKKYKSCRVFYENYVSLTSQSVRSLDLQSIIESKGEVAAAADEELITEATYIFEPTPYAVLAHMETSMLRLTLGHLIYDSRLAQTASRFRAMSAAKERAVGVQAELHTEYNKAKRAMVDQRLKEVIGGLKKIKAERAAGF